MDANREKATAPDGTPYMWLRHSRQFTIDGRPHTISMDVPVPVGASVEQREQLIREAEAGMEQLYRHIESRQRGQRASASENVQRPPMASSPAEARQEAITTSPAQTPVSSQAREGSPVIRLEDKRPAVAATRPIAGAELPDTHNLNASSPMKLSQFITVIKENWKMTPKEAMDLLQLKSLNNMNYRDLLRQIEQVVGQGLQPTGAPRPASGPGVRSQAGQPSSPTQSAQPRPASLTPSPARATPASSTVATKRDSGPQSPQEARGGARPASPAPQTQSSQSPQQTAQKTPDNRERPGPSPVSATSKPETLAGPSNIPVYPLRDERVREPLPIYQFDEEEDEEFEPGEERAHNAVTETMARIKIDELREVRGTSAASAQRLTVLHNLLDSQISPDQLEQLMSGLWHTSSDKKLRQDQVEALISWAKEDDFVDEAEAVLAVLNEE